MEPLQERFGDDLLIVSRHFPLTTIHDNAFGAARAAEAAGLQDEFDAMADLLFENRATWSGMSDPQSEFESYATQLGLDLDQFRNDMVSQAVTDRISRDLAAAGTLQLPGTPSFFLNGDQFSVPLSFEAFETVIQTELDAVDEVFSLNRETGEVFVADSSALDFEMMPAFILAVDVTSGMTSTVDATINLIDVNEGDPSVPGPFSVTLLVSDHGDPSLSAIQSFNIVVNQAPIVDPIDDAPVADDSFPSSSPAGTGPLGFLPTSVSNAFADTSGGQNDGNNGQTDGGQGGSSTQSNSGSPGGRSRTSSSDGSTLGGAPNFQNGPDTGVAHINRSDADEGDDGDDGEVSTDGDADTDDAIRGQDGEPSGETSTGANVPDEVSGTPRQGTTRITDSVISSYQHKTEDMVLDHLVGDRWEWSVDPAHWQSRASAGGGAAGALALASRPEALAVRRPTVEGGGSVAPSVAVAEANPARVAASEPVGKNNGKSAGPGAAAAAAYVYLPLLVTDLSLNRPGVGKGLLRRWREHLLR